MVHRTLTYVLIIDGQSYQNTFNLDGAGSSTGIIFIIYNCGQIAAFPFCGFFADGKMQSSLIKAILLVLTSLGRLRQESLYLRGVPTRHHRHSGADHGQYHGSVHWRPLCFRLWSQHCQCCWSCIHCRACTPSLQRNNGGHV